MKTAICPFCGKKASKFIKFRGDIVGCEFCGIHTKETNADHIRAMTDEKLTKYLCGMGCSTGLSPNSPKCPIPLDYSDEEACYKCWLNWLKQESEEGE